MTTPCHTFARTTGPTPSVRRGSLRTLLSAVHRDQRGSVSLETLLILGAVAIPVLIVIVKFGWPKIKTYFDDGMQRLEHESGNAVENG